MEQGVDIVALCSRQREAARFLFWEDGPRQMQDVDPVGIKWISQGMKELEEGGMDIYVTA